MHNTTRVVERISPPSGEEERRAGHHALQIAMDIFAYSHNISFRLLLLDRLQNVKEIIKETIETGGVEKVLESDDTGAPTKVFLESEDYASLYEQFEMARDWILSLASKQPAERPNALPHGWERAMLALLPHIERQIWLTEISNPLPAHALCRMQDHWALYVLMWCHKNAEKFAEEQPIENALGIPSFVVRPLRSIAINARTGGQHICVPVIGPLFEHDAQSAVNESHKEYCSIFYGFMGRLEHNEWGESSYATPNHDELADALAARIDLAPNEARLRAEAAGRSLGLFLNAKIEPTSGTLARADWEASALLCAWLARWEQAIVLVTTEGDTLRLAHAEHPILVRAHLVSKQGDFSRPNWVLSISQNNSISRSVSVWLDECEKNDGMIKACRIDRIEMFLNRVRERQNAAWSAQVIAINNLLNRHSSKETSAVNDDSWDKTPYWKTGKAEHLLRGYGGRICRHIVSIARADLADIYWFDYSQAPPRLIHAGGYKRVIAHRISREEICKEFDDWAWKSGDEYSNNCPANMRGRSPSQAYRVAATGLEDPPEEGAVNRKKVMPWREGVHCEENSVFAFFNGFPQPTPCDAMGLPLLVTGRVVGVITLAGLVEGQFDPRLFSPLRRAASLAATCMYHQSQLWQMRKLNSLFAHRGPLEFQRCDSNNAFNPLKDISSCLANIFLCPVSHIWLKSKANDNRYELKGYNWTHIFRHPNDKGLTDQLTFTHRPDEPVRQPSNDAFASLAIDMFKSDKPALGSFIQGCFSEERQTTEGFNTKEAESSGCKLGKDFLEAANRNNENFGYIAARRSIFGSEQERGCVLHDLMTFLLVRPTKNEEWEIVGVVTLHDKGDLYREDSQRYRPWDNGWSPVVAHVQTYLPYLLTQAEVLNNPVVEARRYLIHAGRAELLAVLDSTTKLRALLENTLAPDRGVRRAIDEVMSPSFQGDYHQSLAGAEISLKKAWEALNSAASPVWEQNLTQLANIMHDYRELAALGASISVASEPLNLYEEVSSIVRSYERKLRSSGVFRDVVIPEQLRLNVNIPKMWLEIVLKDLIHNAAKYATSGAALEILWDRKNYALIFRNEGPYRSDIDQSEALVKFGVRGSAADTERSITKDSPVDRLGQGLGLWGASLLCGVMRIGFRFDIRPKVATIKKLSGGVTEGFATYEVSLSFPRRMIELPGGAGNDFSDRDYY